MKDEHLHDELAQSRDRVTVSTAFGEVVGGRAKNGSVIFLGMGCELTCCRIAYKTCGSF